MASGYAIERARADELPKLQAIERAAGTLFPPDFVPETASGPTSLEELGTAQAHGLLWVARAADGEPVGFALVELLDAGPHLEEIDVHPDHGRRGVGRALVEHVKRWARAAGHRTLTLTTFRDVPFNQPFYERLGFRALADSAFSPELAELVAEEAARGLDRARRVAMRCELPPGSGRIHHIDLTVGDLERATAFYDRVLPLLGFPRHENVPEGPIYVGSGIEIGLVAARSAAPHDRYAAGLHHLALRAPTRDDVDRAHADLVRLGVRILDAPADYPRYGPGYYAVFFADPDELKLEYVYTPR